MIFVTVGMERFPFDRLIRAVDALRDVLKGEEVYMQVGRASYRPDCPHQAFLSYSDLRAKISRARIVVGHAGVGTLLSCAEFGKIPVMMPRRHCYGEHVDDHQRLFAERMARRGGIVLAREAEELLGCIMEYDERLRSLGGGAEPEPALAGHLREVLERMPGRHDA